MLCYQKYSCIELVTAVCFFLEIGHLKCDEFMKIYFFFLYVSFETLRGLSAYFHFGLFCRRTGFF